MKLLLDNNGNVVVKDDKPVYVYEDGKEIPFDAQSAVTKIGELNNEAKGHRLKYEEAANRLAVFGDLDPAKAKEAIEMVGNVDALTKGKVDAVKAQMAENFQAKERQMIENFNTEKQSLIETLQKNENHIFKMTVESEFLKSPLFNGKDQKTNMTADVAYALFKDHFSVDTQGEQPRIVAKLNGEEILSREHAGKPASFHEAMDTIWEKYPNRTKYEVQANGGGGSGNHNRNDNQEFNKPIDRIKAGLREARR